MRINVEVPLLELEHTGDKVEMYIGPGMDKVTVHYDGTVAVKGNGGGASSFTINVLDLLKTIHRAAGIIT